MTASTDEAYALFDRSPLLRRVHGPEYLNVGWRATADPDPSGALVDRLLDWAPPGTAVAADVACGRGAAAARLARRWPTVRVLAVDRCAAVLGNGPGRDALRADATRLPFGTASVDLVLCVEAALHFDTRAAFFAEAARVLRPGGRLVLTDLLVDPAVPAWAPLVPPANRERGAAEYADVLRGAGLAPLHVQDVADHTWYPYVDALVEAAAAMAPAAREATRRLLATRTVFGYVEAVAQR